MANPMIRVLVLISITGFFVALVALAGATALGGPELAARGWNWGWHDAHHHGRGGDASGPTATREFVWDGSTVLDLAIPAEVEFTQAPGAGKVTITGPKGAVDEILLEDGRLHFDRRVRDAGRLRVVMTAPAVTHFKVGGDDRLVINGYDQETLELDVRGSSEVIAEGKARSIDVGISGASKVDLERLVAENAEVDVSGSGEATIAPTRTADLDISGSGEVNLTTRPDHLNTDVSGSGHVNQRDPAPAETNSPEPAKAL
jgi:hypothetical protein